MSGNFYTERASNANDLANQAKNSFQKNGRNNS